MKPAIRQILFGSKPKTILGIYGASKSVFGGTLAEGRTSTATYLDAAGVLQTAAANAPVWENGGLRHEGAATNKFRASNEVNDTSYWLIFECTVNANNSNGISGGATAETITSTGTSAYDRQGPLTISAGEVLTHWRVLKRSNFDPYMGIYDGTYHQAKFILSGAGSVANVDAGVTARIRALTNDYYLCSITYTTGGAVTAIGPLWISSNKVAAQGFVGAIIINDISQLESGSYVTSYIPTTTAAVTRATCALSIPLILNQNFYQKSAILMRVRAKFANSATAKSWLTPSTTAEGLIDNGSGALTFKDSAANTATANLTSWAADDIILVAAVIDNITGLMSLSASKDNGVTWFTSADTTFVGLTVGANWLLFSANTDVFELLGLSVKKSVGSFSGMKAWALRNISRETQ